MKGRKLTDIFNFVKSRDHNSVINPVETVLTEGKIVELGSDAILVDHRGKEYHIADSAAPIKDDQGNVHGVVIAFTDVTENYILQQQLIDNKERLELAVQGGQLGTWDWDISHGTVIYTICGHPCWDIPWMKSHPIFLHGKTDSP